MAGYHNQHSDTTEAKVSTEAATNFVDSYYRALDRKRETIASFYASSHPNPSNPLESTQRCDISLNGNVIDTPEAMQQLFVEKIPESHHEVQSYDCHVVNSNCNIGLTDGQNMDAKKDGSKMSMVVMISGYVEYGGLGAVRKGFSETVVLIPNIYYKSKADKKWLISSQQFRMV